LQHKATNQARFLVLTLVETWKNANRICNCMVTKILIHLEQIWDLHFYIQYS